MDLTESTITRQIEIAYNDGAPAHVFRETEKRIIKDGAVIAATPHRESYPADSEEAKGVLGDALAGALDQVKALGAVLAAAQEDVHALTEQGTKDAGTIQALQSQVAALQAALDASDQADPVDAQAQVRALIQQELAAARKAAPWWKRLFGLA